MGDDLGRQKDAGPGKKEKKNFRDTINAVKRQDRGEGGRGLKGDACLRKEKLSKKAWA